MVRTSNGQAGLVMAEHVKNLRSYPERSRTSLNTFLGGRGRSEGGTWKAAE